MAKKKVVKKIAKNATSMKTAPACATGNSCFCKPILALIIIALTWWKPTETWSQITITIAAAIILLSAHGCACRN